MKFSGRWRPTATITGSGYRPDADAGLSRRTNPSASHLGTWAQSRPGRRVAAAGSHGTRPRAHLTVTITTRQVRGTQSRVPAELRRSETRSSGVGILARSKSLPALTGPQRPPPDGRTSARRTRPVPGSRNSSERSRSPAAEHSPWSPRPDRKPTPLLRVLIPKLPRNSDCSRPSGPG